LTAPPPKPPEPSKLDDRIDRIWLFSEDRLKLHTPQRNLNFLLPICLQDFYRDIEVFAMPF
jgi:hypothetical protein